MDLDCGSGLGHYVALALVESAFPRCLHPALVRLSPSLTPLRRPAAGLKLNLKVRGMRAAHNTRHKTQQPGDEDVQLPPSNLSESKRHLPPTPSSRATSRHPLGHPPNGRLLLPWSASCRPLPAPLVVRSSSSRKHSSPSSARPGRRRRPCANDFSSFYSHHPCLPRAPRLTVAGRFRIHVACQ